MYRLNLIDELRIFNLRSSFPVPYQDIQARKSQTGRLEDHFARPGGRLLAPELIRQFRRSRTSLIEAIHCRQEISYLLPGCATRGLDYRHMVGARVRALMPTCLSPSIVISPCLAASRIREATCARTPVS